MRSRGGEVKSRVRFRGSEVKCRILNGVRLGGMEVKNES